MEKLPETGKTKAIGVSNVRFLLDLFRNTTHLSNP